MRGRLFRALGLAVLVLALSACEVRTSTLQKLLGSMSDSGSNTSQIHGSTQRFDLTIVNRCRGSDGTVRVYLNGDYLGLVDSARTFRNIRRGSYVLLARGTGAYHKNYSTPVALTRDLRWTIC